MNYGIYILYTEQRNNEIFGECMSTFNTPVTMVQDGCYTKTPKYSVNPHHIIIR